MNARLRSQNVFDLRRTCELWATLSVCQQRSGDRPRLSCGRAKGGPEFRGKNRIGINPVARRGNAGDGRTLEAQPATRAVKLDDENLAAGDQSAAAFAAPFVVEGMPVVEFIEVTEKIEFIFRRELQWNGRAHAGSFASGSTFDNQAHDRRKYRYKPDVVSHIRYRREIRFKFCEGNEGTHEIGS